MRAKKRQKNILEILLKVSKRASSSLEMEKVSAVILEEARAFLDADFSALFLLDEDTKRLFLANAKGFKSNQLENLKVLGGWERINREIVKKSGVIAVNDIRKSPVFKHEKIPFSKERLPLGAFIVVPVKADRKKVIGALIVSNHRKRKSRFTDEDRKLLFTLANHVSIALVNAKLYEDLKKLFLDTVTSLVTAVDAKDPYTHGHSERVARYAQAIAKEMKRAVSDFPENLRLSGLLHDIGKIGVSDNILSKKSTLNTKELQKIHEHPLIGAKIAGPVIKSKGVIEGIAEHHERFDGKGYPKGLLGKRISVEGRVISVADAFDTITTERPYQKAYTAEEAAAEIRKSAGTYFDPGVVKAFSKSFTKYPNLWQAKLVK